MLDEDTETELIEKAAEYHDVDLATAISTVVPDPWQALLLDHDPDAGYYVLYSYSEPSPGEIEATRMRFPEERMGQVSAMFHAGSMHQANRDLDGPDLPLRSLAEQFGLAHPVGDQ